MYIVFRHNVIAQLMSTVYINDYSINRFLYALRNQKIHVTHFIAIFVLLWWSGIKPAISPRYVCTSSGTYKRLRMTLAPLGCSLEAPAEQARELLWKSRFLEEKFQHPVGGRK